MSIKFTCDQCGRELSAPESSAGKKGRCNCGAVLRVPEPVSVPPEPQTSEPQAMPEQVDFDNLTYSTPVALPPPPRKPAEEGRPCPNCGEMIAKSSVKCRCCQQIVNPAMKRAAKKNTVTTRAYTRDDDMSTTDWVIAIVCSSIGVICGVVRMIQGRASGKQMLVVSLVMHFIWVGLKLLLQQATRQ